jgi:hypothetical protein
MTSLKEWRGKIHWSKSPYKNLEEPLQGLKASRKNGGVTPELKDRPLGDYR